MTHLQLTSISKETKQKSKNIYKITFFRYETICNKTIIFSILCRKIELSYSDTNTWTFYQSCMQTAIFLNPFGYIQKNNPTLEHYIRNVYKTMEVVFYDINIGVGIARAEGTLAFMFVPYEMLILSVFKKFRILPIQNSHFHIFLITTCCLSLLFTYFLSEKNEEYIGYFHKFESHKNNAV